MSAALEARSSGIPLVGLVGTVTPLELVIAAGAMPVSVMGRAEDWGVSVDPMEEGHEPEISSLFRQATTGFLDCLDLLVVPSTSDGYRYLYPYLKEMQRQGLGECIPTIVPYDFLFGEAPAVQRHSRTVMRDLCTRLAVLTGKAVTDAALAQAIELTNQTRQQVRKLQGLRAVGQVSGADAHRMVRATAFADVASYAEVLTSILATQAADPRPAKAPRLLLISAVPLYHERLHEVLEFSGALVIAEDDEWGSRRGSPDISVEGAPMEALFAHARTYTVSPRMLQAEREAWACAQMQSGMYDGVVFYIPPCDQFFGWRYPDLDAVAAANGLPTLLIREDVLDAAAGPAIKQASNRFIDGLVDSKKVPS